MRNFAIILSLVIVIFSVGCSKSSLEKIDLDKIKKEALEKKEDIKKIQEKIKKSIAVKDQQLGKKKETAREKMIGQSIGYRYDVNLLPDYTKLTPFLKKYIEAMGWDDLNWLEDVHMGYEEGKQQKSKRIF